MALAPSEVAGATDWPSTGAVTNALNPWSPAPTVASGRGMAQGGCSDDMHGDERRIDPPIFTMSHDGASQKALFRFDVSLRNGATATMQFLPQPHNKD